MSVELARTVNLATIAVGLLMGGFMLYFAAASVREHEPRAARRALVIAIILLLLYGLTGASGQATQTAIAGSMLLLLTFAALAIVLLPIGKKLPDEADAPNGRIDERDIMFSRMELQPGTERFDAYYQRRPEKKPLDDNFRKRPGLMGEGALYYDPFSAAATEASFKTVAAFHALLDEEAAPQKREAVDPAKMTVFLKQWAKKLGALSVGITELKPYHLYSVVGRGDRYGEPVTLHHRFALALTVEMDKTMVDRAPHGPTAMESAQQYLNAGAIAVQLAEFIRELGYSARAHIDGSYRVVCPLVARDAGLGEIGRMGLLMTPRLGPRVRLAVVTTDMSLVVDERVRDLTMIDFCERCLKCADACPSKSIPFEGRREIDGVKRWQINSESCFTYWCTVGTDCAVCMRTCPYSHPDNFLHNLVRAGIKQSVLFRELAIKMDDFFYGRVPKPAVALSWMDLTAD
jgi:ferredoxin